MPADRGRRNPKTSQFDIIVIPVGQGGKSRTYRFTRLKFVLWSAGALLLVVLFTVGALMFTPLALIIPLSNPVLEEKYGRQLLETQKELRALAEDVDGMREYNAQLRKVLGDRADSGVAKEAEQEIDPSPAPLSAVSSLDESTLLEEYGEFVEDHRSFNTIVASEPMSRAALPLVKPVSGILSQRFNPEQMHFGVDYAAKAGTPVFAAGDGYVVFANWTHDGGNMVMISHSGGYLTVYKHNQSLLISQHVPVRRGDIIALLGSSGKTSTGPHLHFEVWRDGIPVDPEEFLLMATKGPVSGELFH